jgi:transcriptional adapter 2-alpha
MTVSRRKNKPVAKPDDKSAAESGVQYHCDVCGLDISSTVRISCATCETQPGALDTYDLCCCCFLEGSETGSHKAWHNYRVVEQHAYPIFCHDWGADEELLLIDGAQIYGLGNWADIADHIGNRTKEEVEDHYVKVYIEGRDGTMEGNARAEQIVQSFLESRRTLEPRGQQLPIAGPNIHYQAQIDAEEFQRQKRKRIEDMREDQAAFNVLSSSQTKDGQVVKPVPPKPLVSAPTSHSELAGFMPGRLEFESEYEQDAENFVKDMEFGKVYRFGGGAMPSEFEALGQRAEKGKSRMEASGRGGPSLGSRGATKANKRSRSEEGEEKEDKEEGDEEDKEKGDSDEEGAEEETQDKEGDEEEDDEEMDEGEEASQMDNSVMDVDSSQAVQADQSAVKKDSTATSAQAPPAETDDRAADWDEDEGDLDLKLTVLDIYNERLDRRGRRKEFIFSRNLVDYKRSIAAERKRPKEERDILNRVRHFAQMQTAVDFEEFYNGLCYEDALRRAAAQLQMYRRAGVTNLTDAAKFDAEQIERARKALVAAEGGLAAFPLGGAQSRSASGRNARDTSAVAVDDADSGTFTPTTKASKKSTTDDKKPARKPPKPLDLSQHPSLNLLTRAEQELCSVVRIQPQVFLIMKKDIIVEYVRRKGRFTRRESRILFKCDVNKVGRVYDLLESEGYLQEAARMGSGWDGTGTPPGWIEKPIKKPVEADEAGAASPLPASASEKQQDVASPASAQPAQTPQQRSPSPSTPPRDNIEGSLLTENHTNNNSINNTNNEVQPV